MELSSSVTSGSTAWTEVYRTGPRNNRKLCLSPFSWAGRSVPRLLLFVGAGTNLQGLFRICSWDRVHGPPSECMYRCVSWYVTEKAGLLMDCSWEGMDLNHRVVSRAAVGSNLVGLPPWVPTGMPPSSSLSKEDYTQTMAWSGWSWVTRLLHHLLLDKVGWLASRGTQGVSPSKTLAKQECLLTIWEDLEPSYKLFQDLYGYS